MIAPYFEHKLLLSAARTRTSVNRSSWNPMHEMFSAAKRGRELPWERQSLDWRVAGYKSANREDGVPGREKAGEPPALRRVSAERFVIFDSRKCIAVGLWINEMALPAAVCG